jgi:hypothetical protein
MRLSLAALLPLFLAFSLPANAGGFDMMTITCSELANADKSQSDEDHFGAAVMLSWMAGYHATEEQGTVVDFDALKVDVQRTVDYCNKYPKIGVYTASEKFMGENATEAGPEAADLSTIKCQKVIEAANSNGDDKEGLTIVMMWLAGYYASYAEDTILDREKLQKRSFEIGKACAQNEESGLVTVADKVMADE